MASLPFRSLLRTVLLAFGAATTMCTPFKEDTPGGSGSVDSSPGASGDSGPEALARAARGGEDGGADAGAGLACDPSKPFGPPTFVPGLANIGATTVGGLRLSPDSLTGYFHATYPARSIFGQDLYSATRAAPDAPFENVAPLGDGTVNTVDEEVSPTLGRDGLMLVFARLYRQLWHLHYGTRSTTSVPFAYGGPLSISDPGAHDAAPFLREDGKVLYFSSTRNAGNDWDIFRSTWNGSSFDPAVPVSELNTAFREDGPVVTPDDLMIYFGSTRPAAGAQGSHVWMATRASTKDRFSSPVNVTELSMGATYVAQGGCSLYLVGGSAQYVAQKPAQ